LGQEMKLRYSVFFESGAGYPVYKVRSNKELERWFWVNQNRNDHNYASLKQQGERNE